MQYGYITVLEQSEGTSLLSQWLFLYEQQHWMTNLFKFLNWSKSIVKVQITVELYLKSVIKIRNQAETV